MRAILDIIEIVLKLYVYLLIASAVLSWLIAFNVVNTRNQFVAASQNFFTGSPSRCCGRSAAACRTLAALTFRRSS